MIIMECVMAALFHMPMRRVRSHVAKLGQAFPVGPTSAWRRQTKNSPDGDTHSAAAHGLGNLSSVIP